MSFTAAWVDCTSAGLRYAGDGAKDRNGPTVFLNHGMDAEIHPLNQFLNVVEMVADSTDAEQVSNPPGIFGIILIPFYSLDPFRAVNDNTDAPLLQDTEHEHPILSGRLHRTSRQSVSWSQSANRFKSELNVENRFF